MYISKIIPQNLKSSVKKYSHAINNIPGQDYNKNSIGFTTQKLRKRIKSTQI